MIMKFVTGGQACGKSIFAQQQAERFEYDRTYIATARIWDNEIEEKVNRHIEQRGNRFKTIEEPMDLRGAIEKAAENSRVILVDCLTMWVNNVIVDELEEGVEKRLKDLVEELKRLSGREFLEVIFVSNEVGWGIIPANELSRKYVRALGTVNKAIASLADECYLLVSGIPVRIK